MKGRTMEIHKKNISAAAVLSGQITVPKVSQEWRKEIQGEWDRIAKPLGSFGKLEKIHPPSVPSSSAGCRTWSVWNCWCAAAITELWKKG